MGRSQSWFPYRGCSHYKVWNLNYFKHKIFIDSTLESNQESLEKHPVVHGYYLFDLMWLSPNRELMQMFTYNNKNQKETALLPHTGAKSPMQSVYLVYR